MKSSEILEVARHKIDVGHEWFICNAITSQRYELGHLDGQRIARLLLWIRQSLGPHTTLEAWLDNLGYIVYNRDLSHKLRETRLAWLDNMISICRQEGD